MVRCVLISDTHGIYDDITPDGDILLCAGDVSMGGTFKEIAAFNTFLNRQPQKFKIYCAGNHDWLYQTDPELAPGIVENSVYLFDTATTIKGLKIFGTPWQKAFCNWAFNKDDKTELPKLYERIPEGLDILLVHNPPYGILDTVDDGPHLGSKALWERIKVARPKVTVFGHIHSSGGRIQKKDGMTFVNASLLNEQYEPQFEPIIIDL